MTPTTRAALTAGLLLVTAGCGVDAGLATPRCTSPERLALVAQSVPTATYVPCLQPLPQGWRVTDFEAALHTSRFTLLSDRSRDHPVLVTLQARCDVAGTSPLSPRAEGVRSSTRLTSVTPTYTGVLYDVFAGGCVSYRFAFPRGPHIPLMEELTGTVGLMRRQQLRLDLLDQLGVELDP